MHLNSIWLSTHISAKYEKGFQRFNLLMLRESEMAETLHVRNRLFNSLLVVIAHCCPFSVYLTLFGSWKHTQKFKPFPRADAMQMCQKSQSDGRPVSASFSFQLALAVQLDVQ